MQETKYFVHQNTGLVTKSSTAKSAKKNGSSSKAETIKTKKKKKRKDFLKPRATGERFREWVERNLDDSPAGNSLDFCMATLSILIVLLYIVTNWEILLYVYEPWVEGIDFYVNVIFSVEYLLRLYAAFDRYDHMTRIFGIVEFIVLIPSWTDFIIKNQSGMDPNVINDLMGARVLRALRILRVYRFLDFTQSNLQREVLATLLTVISIVIGTAGVLQFTEWCEIPCHADAYTCGCQNLSYLDLLYFVVVSISTLGYGDIAPVSKNGKSLISFIILMTLIIVPIQVNRILAVISSHTDYSSSYREAKQHPHVLVTGHVDASSLSVMFREFFHPNNVNWNEKVVILNPRPPTVAVKKLLNEYESKVQYIVGSPMIDEDLDRAVIQTAVACYVLVNRNTMESQYADQCSALITIALRRGNPICPIYSQIIDGENAANLLKMGASDIVVSGHLKFSILGRSCQVRGLPTLLSNLLLNSPYDVENKHTPFPWQKNYLYGYSHGIFLVDVPRSFTGLTFGDLIRFLYDNSPVIPIAMLTEDGVEFVDHEFKLGGTADPNLCCKVFAVAQSLSSVEKVMNFPADKIFEYRKTLRKKARSVAGGEAGYDKKKIKPALDNDQDKVHSAVLTAYVAAQRDKPIDDQETLDYEEFTNTGPPANISNHIVVCGFPKYIYSFLKTIRDCSKIPPPPQDPEADIGIEESNQTPSEKEAAVVSPPVVFLSPEALDEAQFDTIRHIPDIYFVMGSPVNFLDLKSTRIDTAISVLVLTATSSSVYSDQNMIDADAITTLRYIIEITHHSTQLNLIVELEKSTNVKLLSFISGDPRSSRNPTLSGLVGHRASRARVRRPVGGITNESVYNAIEEAQNKIDNFLVLEEFIVSGRVYMNSTMDALMSECYRKKWITPFINMLIHGSKTDPEAKKLYQIEVPDAYLKLRYIDVFRRVLEKLSSVCIGIWRQANGPNLPHPCVLINPPPEMGIEAYDRLYIVGRPMTSAQAANILTGT